MKKTSALSQNRNLMLNLIEFKSNSKVTFTPTQDGGLLAEADSKMVKLGFDLSEYVVFDHSKPSKPKRCETAMEALEPLIPKVKKTVKKPASKGSEQ